MKKMMVFFLTIMALLACNKAEQPIEEVTGYHEFESFTDFKSTLKNIVHIIDPEKREESLSIFWDSLKANNQIPFVLKDSVAFLYRGNENSVSWAGDFSGWNSLSGVQLEESGVWMLEKVFPLDARLDYKIVLGSNWILDPDNNCIQYSGFGPNSELRMPEWEYPIETILGDGVIRGNLSDKLFITASLATLNYKIQYKVYTPAGYNQLNNLPVIYVTDGHEYADDKLGSMIITLDNLVHSKTIPPVIAVFIDPRDPDTGDNKRHL